MPRDYFDARTAETYEAKWPHLFDPAVVEPTVSFLAGLAGSGAALEFGIGTGRIALPLHARGVRVHGIDLSPAMAARLRAQPGADEVPVAIGDFAATRVEGNYTRRLPPGQTVVPFAVTPEHLGFEEYDVAAQIAWSHHYWITGGQFGTRATPHRYLWPSELDLMARMAGMTLRERFADWNREPFTGDSPSHVSVWEKP
jgi:hypothetical protein